MATSDETQGSPAVTAIPSSLGSTIRALAYLGSTLRINGEITGDEDLKVDGKIEGPISLPEHRLTVGSGAQVNGKIVAREIVVYGEVKGTLRGRDRVEIKKAGSVVGELSTARIMIEDGAYVKAAIEIERGHIPVRTDPDTLLTLAEKDFKLKSIRAEDSSQ
jgi:cytoskeletal protein CcmA (bactofilin family)